MADNAEKKNIAKLDFNVSDALNNLDAVAKKLEKISNSSEKSFEKIEKNFNKAFSGGDYSQQIKEMQNKMQKFEQLSEKQQKSISTSMHKEISKRYTKHLEYQEKMAYSDKKLANEQILLDAKKNTKIEMQNNQHANKMEEINARQAKSVETLYDKIGQYAKTYVIYQGFNALRKGIQETIDEMIEVEQQMVAIDRVLNESSLNIDKYRDKLINLAADYGNEFNNVADITLRLAQAGFSSQEALALTEKTLLALNTAELDATQATDDMVAVMAQWGLMTGDAAEEARTYGEIIDKINKVADNYPTTSADLMNALKKVSSAFNLAGASIDETIATIVAAEKASQRGGKVIGTALANIVQQIKAEGKLNLAEELGLDFFEDDAKTKFKPVLEIFQEMSDRMEQLKNEGKESSVEMQSLLELFTVFRRNIGASLLGEMSGEDNTYLSALETSINSVGYSLQENEKYMNTAKAAQAQFNAELLKLKTEVWDNQLENVFREMLSIGKDFIGGLTNIIDTFGILPTTIATATAAFSLFGKKIDYNSLKKYSASLKEVRVTLQDYNKFVKEGYISTEEFNESIGKESPQYVKKYITGLNGASASMSGLITKTVLQTAKQIALNLVVAAGEAALTFGLSFAIQALVGVIDDWIHNTERMIEKNKELMETAQESAEKIKTQRENLESLTKQLDKTIQKYDELEDTDVNKTEATTQLYELQAQINEALEGTGKRVNVVNESLNEQGNRVIKINEEWEKQIKLLDQISYQQKIKEVEGLQTAMEAANANLELVNSQNITGDYWQSTFGGKSSTLASGFVKAGISEDQRTIFGTVNDIAINPQMYEFNKTDITGQIKLLEEWRDKLKLVNDGDKDVSESLKLVNAALKSLNDTYETANVATEKYQNALSELYAMTGQVDTFDTFLDAISNSYNIEGPRQLIEELKGINQEFRDGTINVEEYFNKIQDKISQIDLQAQGEELEAYQAIFAGTAESLAEGISQLNAGLESGTINFADYASGTKEAAENMLALRVEQENLSLVDGVWQNAAGEVDEYANSLKNAIGELSNMGDLLLTIGDNYDYIAEHANAAGEAAFKQSEVGTEAYNNLANNFAANLAKMNTDNNNAYKAITDATIQATGIMRQEEESTNDYINRVLLSDADALNAALNESANQVSLSTNRVTQSMGNVLSKLGEAISSFNYTITAAPFISGKFELRKDENGIINGITLPRFGFDITGTGNDSIKNLGSALSSFGTNLGAMASSQFRYNALKSAVEPYNSGSSGFSPSSFSPSTSGGGGGSSSGGSGGSTRSSSTTTDASKEEYDDYKDRLAMFKDFIAERERLEKRWVDKQKELGLLSNDDYLYIIQQRIERYEEYLKMVENATWMHEEDKLALEKEYNEKIEDLQVDYLGYLKKKLDEEISALKESNKEKINIIKNEATERINALKKVEKENDRIRAKEEYEKNRQKHLEDISYWEQRSGRQAQEALKEAKANLKELDEQWEKQMEDWSIEDQIKAIEEERDAQVKAIEDAQEAEIKAMQDVYDAKVKLFAETGQIIYENSVIQSKALYNQYKNNFIDPLMAELEELNKAVSTPSVTTTTTQQAQSTPTPEASPTPEPERQYETYVIQWGDTLTSIARRFGTTIEDILDANPYVTDRNKIYAGRTLEIPKFHEGGIVGGLTEGFALLKPGEVVLKPEWASSLNRMMKYFDNISSGNTSANLGGPTIEVTGNLVQIDANISNKTDADYLTKKVERMLKEKFNVNK